MDGLGVLNFAKMKVAPLVRQLLARNQLSFADIDVVIFHQASKMAMDTLAKVLKVPPEKAYSNIGNVGNLVSTSIPAALKDAMDAGVAGPGKRLLLVGFGVGLSTAVAIVDI
jgi:3-oxoacyl-[acyl-carrier-protein] synthase-3